MRFKFMIWGFLLWLPLAAQNNVFILVDLSGNPINDPHKITGQMRQEAIELVRGVVTAKYNTALNQNWYLSGNADSRIQAIVTGKGQPLIGRGGYLMIMPFGERNTYKNFKINLMSSYPADFNRFYQFPFRYDQQLTFSEIARAKAADVAEDANIRKYFLVMITGKGEDIASQSYSMEEIGYLDNYKSSVIVNSLAIFRYNDQNIDFKVVISEIDISKMTGRQPSRPNIIQPTNVDRKILEIISPKGTRRTPFETGSNQIVVSWNCVGCSDSSVYTINVKSMENNDTERIKPAKVIGRFSHSIPLSPGEYQIKVSAVGVGSSVVYVKIKSKGGWGWLFTLFLLGALGYLGYFVWKNFLRNREGTTGASKERGMFDLDNKKNDGPAPPPGSSGGGSSGGDLFDNF